MLEGDGPIGPTPVRESVKLNPQFTWVIWIVVSKGVKCNLGFKMFIEDGG
jgi:hypothetical protein